MSEKTSHRRSAAVRRNRIAHTLRVPVTETRSLDLLARADATGAAR